MGVKDIEEFAKPAKVLPPWILLKKYAEESIKFYRENPGSFMQELLSGFMISVLQVPESVAFSYVAGVHPMQGLYGSFWMGLTTALLGGRPGMISGCAGALAVVIKEVMLDSGPFGHKCPEERREYLLFVMVLTGILQLVCALCQCAHLVRLIPKTAFLGFFNGLAVVIFMSQIETFKKSTTSTGVGVAGCRVVDFGFREDSAWYTLNEGTTWLMLTEVAIVMIFMEGIPLLPKIPLGKFGQVSLAKVVPPSLIGLLLAMFYEWALLRPNGWSTPVVKDVSRISGSVPPWHIPSVPWGEWETWSKSLPIAVSLCAIGLVESVLTLQAVDQILDQQTPVRKKNQECFAQGVANLLSGFFMAMGGDAMIGQSTINAMNGAQGRLSAFVAALFLLLHIVAFGGFIEAVPTAALAGILFVVVIHTFSWASLKILLRRALPLYMCVTIVLVTVVSVLTNLAIGIAVGIVWESVIFVWIEGSRLGVTPFESENRKTYRVEGTLFFANTDTFNKHFTPQADPKNVIVDLANSRVLDFSALYTLNVLSRRYETANKRLLLRMKDEDYERYSRICDESLEEESLQRLLLSTNTVSALHGRVHQSQLRPMRYQEFEPLRAVNTSPSGSPHATKNCPQGSVFPMAGSLPNEDAGSQTSTSVRDLSSISAKAPEFLATGDGTMDLVAPAETVTPMDAKQVPERLSSSMLQSPPASASLESRDGSPAPMPGVPDGSPRPPYTGEDDDDGWVSEESV